MKQILNITVQARNVAIPEFIISKKIFRFKVQIKIFYILTKYLN